MSKDEAIRKLREIGESASKPLEAHREAEGILLAVLESHGLEDVAHAYKQCENEAGGFWFDWQL